MDGYTRPSPYLFSHWRYDAPSLHPLHHVPILHLNLARIWILIKVLKSKKVPISCTVQWNLNLLVFINGLKRIEIGTGQATSSSLETPITSDICVI